MEGHSDTASSIVRAARGFSPSQHDRMIGFGLHGCSHFRPNKTQESSNAGSIPMLAVKHQQARASSPNVLASWATGTDFGMYVWWDDVHQMKKDKQAVGLKK